MSLETGVDTHTHTPAAAACTARLTCWPEHGFFIDPDGHCPLVPTMKDGGVRKEAKVKPSLDSESQAEA